MSSEIDRANLRQRRAMIFESYRWDDGTKIAGQIKTSLEEAEYEVCIDREHISSKDPPWPPCTATALW